MNEPDDVAASASSWMKRAALIGAVVVIGLGLVSLGYGTKLDQQSGTRWTSLAPETGSCTHDGSTMECKAVDQDGRQMILTIVDRHGGGANMYVTSVDQVRGVELQAVGGFLVVLVTFMASLMLVRRRHSDAGFRRRLSLLWLAVPVGAALTSVVLFIAQGGPAQLIRYRLGGSLFSGELVAAMLLFALWILARQQVRIGGRAMTSTELAAAVAVLRDTATSDDAQVNENAAELARRRLARSNHPGILAAALAAVPVAGAAAFAIFQPWAWLGAALFAVNGAFLVRLNLRQRAEAQRYLAQRVSAGAGREAVAAEG